MRKKLTRREFEFLLAGAAASPLSAADSSPAHGILKVTRSPRLGRPPHTPPGKIWNYELIFPFQVARGLAGAIISIKQSFGPGQDYANGGDVVLFRDRLKIDTSQAIALSRNENVPNPNDGGRMVELTKHPDPAAFIPLGAKGDGGAPHPHAGTGFALVRPVAWTLEEREPGPRVGDHPLDRRTIVGGEKYYQSWEIYQFSYDGSRFHISGGERVSSTELLPGWVLFYSGMTSGIPDGDDLLIPMCGGRPGRPRGSGVMRWSRSGDKWRPVSFQLVTGEDGATHQPELMGASHSATPNGTLECSLIRDLDGELMLSGRGPNASGHPLRVWKTSNQGQDWKLIVYVGGISSAPLSINRAADGTPYIAANRYQYQTQYKNTPSIPFFLGSNGRPIPDGGTRETLMAWPINDARNAVEIPVMIRDGLQEFGPPPNGTIWSIDHPSGCTVQLADGKWRHVIGYRVFEKEENVAFVAPTPHTGAYLEEVISAGKPIPAWNF